MVPRLDLPDLPDAAPVGRRPTVVVLVAHWETSTERGWLTRQVAGALANHADVHIVTPDGTRLNTSSDGVFIVHSLGSPLNPVDEQRRDLLIAALADDTELRDASDPREVATLLDQGLLDAWDNAAEVLEAVRPELIVIAGCTSIGAQRAVDRSGSDAPVALLALATDVDSMVHPHFEPLYQRSGPILAVTGSEQAALQRHCGAHRAVWQIGAPLAANPSALTEPNSWVENCEYALILTNAAEQDTHWENESARFLRMRFPNLTIGISHTDAFCVWHRGTVRRGWPIERSSDLDRLMAWALTTVDLRPGELFGRRCVTSLLFGTPIVVPSTSRAREHAELGGGGLWFTSRAELTWCLEAMTDRPIHHALGAQGRRYAEAQYGSTDRFIERVIGACGLISRQEAGADVH